MTASPRPSWRVVLPVLLAVVLATGCASLRPPAVPAAPPAGYLGAVQAAQAGFHAVYEGELRIWFHSFSAIWYVAVPPGGTSLAVAVLSPTGVKIMQMHGAPGAHACVVAVPAADRLQPYGAALWGGLWWGLAAGGQAPVTDWVRQGNEVAGCAMQGAAQARFLALATNGALAGLDVREAGRRRYAIRLAEARHHADRAYAGRVRIECARPRCRLTLALKSLRWSDDPGPTDHAAGP